MSRNRDRRRPASGSVPRVAAATAIRSFDGDDRGQTLQDYTAGISVFILAVATVVAVVPTLFTPFQAPVGAADTAAVQRVGGAVYDDVTTPNGSLHRDSGRLATVFDTDAAALRERYGLASHRSLNVTLSAGGTVHRSVGPSPGDRATAAVRRVVVGGGPCADRCTLVVRVW